MGLFSRRKNPVMQEISDTDILSESNKIEEHNNSHEFDLNIEKSLKIGKCIMRYVKLYLMH